MSLSRSFSSGEPSPSQSIRIVTSRVILRLLKEHAFFGSVLSIASLELVTPSPSISGSQKSPIPSLSRSSWSGFEMSGQLSSPFSIKSLSPSSSLSSLITITLTLATNWYEESEFKASMFKYTMELIFPSKIRSSWPIIVICWSTFQLEELKVSLVLLIPNSVISDNDMSIETFDKIFVPSLTLRIEVVPFSETELGALTITSGISLSSDIIF